MPEQATYRRGDRGPVVAEIKGKLVAVGLLPVSSPGNGNGTGTSGYGTSSDETTSPRASAQSDVFDEACDAAVRQFQQQRGLSVDGIVGPQTRRVLDEARWQLGDRLLRLVPGHPLVGDDVAWLQRRLLAMGFDIGRVDGIFGTDTDRGLREFQRNVGLMVDGICGPETYKALDRLARTVTGGAPHAMRESEVIHRSGPILRGKVVVIDPAHGPADAKTGPTEPTIAWDVDAAEIVHDIARRITGRLEAMGVRTYLSRGSDSNLDETARAGFVNATEADLLISLHLDAHPNPQAQGVSTYYYGNDRLGGWSAVGETFAGLVQREIVARTDFLDCRTHAKTWDILRRTRMPAVRLDLGYVTNADDAERLSTSDVRDRLAEAVVVAVQRLYLPPDDDADTGVMQLPVLSR
jgi:N-acetylmuramoyl-L-alanine amidase